MKRITWCADGICRISDNLNIKNESKSIEQIINNLIPKHHSPTHADTSYSHLKYNISKDVMDSILTLFHKSIELSNKLINNQINVIEFIKQYSSVQNSIMDINRINNDISNLIIKDIVKQYPLYEKILHDTDVLLFNYIKNISTQFNVDISEFDILLRNFYSQVHISNMFIQDKITHIQYKERREFLQDDIKYIKNIQAYYIISNQDPLSLQIIKNAHEKYNK